MDALSLSLLSTTGLALFWGLVWGLIRGRNRAILRLILIVISAVAAIILRTYVVDAIMSLDTGDGSIADLLATAFAGEAALPESIQTMVLTLVEILIGFMLYFFIFFLLKFLTLIFIYPICKIFVKKGAVRHRGVGALVGLLQGVVMAVLVCGPLAGFYGTMGTMLNMDLASLQGSYDTYAPAPGGASDDPMAALEELKSMLDFDAYNESPVAKIYDTVGGWLYDNLTTKTDASGNVVSLDSTVDSLDAAVNIVVSFGDMASGLDILADEQAPTEEKVDSLTALGEKLMTTGGKLEALDPTTKATLNTVIDAVKEIAIEADPSMAEIFESLDIDTLDISSVGETMMGFATMLEKSESGDALTTEDATLIISGFANNEFLLEVAEGTNLGIAEGNEEAFTEAINAANVDAETKAALMALVGLN